MFSLLRKIKTHSLPFDLQIDLFKKTIEPIQLYGCEVWGNEKVDVLERVQLRYYKYIFITPPFEEWLRGIKCYPCPSVRACVRPFVRPCFRPLSKFGVRSITFEILHRFNWNLVCWYIISKHRSSSIWVTIH